MSIDKKVKTNKMAFPNGTFLYKHKTLDDSVIYELFVGGKGTEVFFNANRECIRLVSFSGEGEEGNECGFVDTRLPDEEEHEYDFDLCSDGDITGVKRVLDISDEDLTRGFKDQKAARDDLEDVICMTSATYKFRYSRVPNRYRNISICGLPVFDGYEEALKRIAKLPK